MRMQSGVYDQPAMPGMRAVMSVDDTGAIVEWYAAQSESFDESQVDRMRTRLVAWNLNRRVLKMVP